MAYFFKDWNHEIKSNNFSPPFSISLNFVYFENKSMARILTGIQSTGTPHLGNILGAIIPAIDMVNDPKNDSFLFIADMHSLTLIKDGEE